MLATLIQIDGYDPVAAANITVRYSSIDDSAVCHLNGQTWWPGIAKLPALGYDLSGAEQDGRIATTATSLTVSVEPWPNLPRYALADARIQIWTGEVGDAWASYTQRFDGRVISQPKVADGRAEIAIGVDDRWLDTPLLATYAGTGGAEGGPALKGTIKPLCIGAPRYVPGVLVDPINTVIQLSAYGAIQDVEAALERLARFGASAGDYADFAALVAATVPAGRWATSKAGGWVRQGAPPLGMLSYLVKGDNAGPNGWVRKPGAVIRRLALLSGGSGKINDASLDALDIARPYNVSRYISEQTTARDLIGSLAASVNAAFGVSWLGKLFVAPVGFAAPTITLAADGSALPPIEKVETLDNGVPYWRMGVTAEQTWAVHGLEDIAFTAQLVDLGDYVAGTTYREGNIVQDQGSSWLYINPTPSAGNAPPALPISLNAYWKILAKAGSDGTLAWTPIFNPADWQREGGTFTALTTAYFDTETILSSKEQLPNLAVSWTVQASPKKGMIGITDGARAYVIYTYTDTNTLLFGTTTDPATPGSWVYPKSFGAIVPGQRLTIAHRGSYIAVLRDGVEGYRVTGVDPASTWKLFCYTGQADVSFEDVTLSVVGTDGASSVVGFLTNESHTVPTAADGSGASFTGAGGTMRVFNGLTEVSTGAGVVYSVVSPTGLTMAINASTGVYSVSAMSADKGTATLRAVYGGITIDKVYSISKAPAGAAGINAKTLIVLSDRQTIAYNAAGAPTPTTQTTTFSTNKQNTTATVTWSVTDATGAAKTPVTSYLSAATGNSVTMTEAQFAAARGTTSGVIVTGTLTDGGMISDKISVVRVGDGATGPQGVSPIDIQLTETQIVFGANPGGTPNPGQLPYPVGIVVRQGIGTITPTSVVIPTGAGIGAINCTASVTLDTLTINSLTFPTGSVDIDVTAAGQTKRVRLGFSSQLAGADGGAARLDTSTALVAWTSFAQHGSSIAMNASATGKLRVNYKLSYKTALGGLLTCVAKLQYRSAGGTWTDVPGSQKTGTTSEEQFEPNRQSGGVAYVDMITLSSLTPSGPYEVRVMDYAQTVAQTTGTATRDLYVEEYT